MLKMLYLQTVARWELVVAFVISGVCSELLCFADLRTPASYVGHHKDFCGATLLESRCIVFKTLY